MARSWLIRWCPDCRRERVHLKLGEKAPVCIGKLKNATRKCGK